MLRLTTAACLAAATLSSDETQLVHAPAAGTSRTTTIESEQQLAGGRLEVVMDGAEVPQMYLPELDLDVTERRGLVFSESFEQGGWLRRYDEVTWTNAGSMSMDMGGEAMQFPWSSAGETRFEGRVVRFNEEDDGTFAREFADGGGGETSLLDGLQADLGLGALLPQDPLEIGATWEIDGQGLALLFEPGGDFRWELPPQAAAELLFDYESREYSGTLELELAQLEDDGARARCTLQGTLVRRSVKPGDLTQVPVVDGDATDTIVETWDAQGELVWDVAANQVASLSLAGPFTQATTTVRDPNQPGSTYESLFTVGGTYRVSFESVAAEAGAVQASSAR